MHKESEHFENTFVLPFCLVLSQQVHTRPRLSIGKERRPLAFKKSRNERLHRPFVDLGVIGHLIKDIIKAKTERFDLFGQVDACFGLVDEHFAVGPWVYLIFVVKFIVQWLQNINIAGHGGFHGRHGSFPHHNPNPHFSMGAGRCCSGVGIIH